MFNELRKLKELEKRLRAGEFERVLELARDPAIRKQRRALEAAARARAGLLAAAEEDRAGGRHGEALARIRILQREENDADLGRLADFLEEEQTARGRRREGGAAVEAGGDARRLPESHRAEVLLREVASVRREALQLVEEAHARIERGELREALKGLEAAENPVAQRDALPGLIAEAIRRREYEVLADGTARAKALAGLELSFEPAAGLLLEGAEKQVRAGEAQAAERLLGPFPLGAPQDDRASALQAALRQASAARAAAWSGDGPLFDALLPVVTERLGSRALVRALKARREETERQVQALLPEVEEELRNGRLERADQKLQEVLSSVPAHRKARLLSVAVQERLERDRSALREARHLLEERHTQEAIGRLTALLLMRPRWSEALALLEEAERRRVQEALEASESEGASAAQPGRPVPAGVPWLLRVDGGGEWLVDPRDSLVIGNKAGGQADLPILAQIGARHARLERREDEGEARYWLEPLEGRPVTRNGGAVTDPVCLGHGDVIALGRYVTFTFRSPLPGNGTAALELGGGFKVRGCSKVLLFAESGKEGAIVLGEAPDAHVPLGPDADRLELFREEAPNERLLARCPPGVSIGGGPARPQVAVRAGLALSTLDLTASIELLG
jgi:hypothetical protein